MTDNHGELILYRTDDGRTEVHLRAAEGTVWLTQAEMAALFQTTPQNITQHIQSVYDDAEIEESATCKDYLQVRQEGSREVRRTVKTYRLESATQRSMRSAAERTGSHQNARPRSTCSSCTPKPSVLSLP